ncbi:MAG: GGDEF domain-containing protein [Acidobacteriota bacterium]
MNIEGNELPNRDPVAPTIAILVGLGLLLFAPLLPALRASGPLPWTPYAVVICLAALAAVHRPLAGGGLGVGAAAVPLVLTLWGPLPAAWLALLVATGGELGYRALLARQPEALPERRGLVRVGQIGVRSAVATLAASIVWIQAAAPSPLRFDDLQLQHAAIASMVSYVVLAAIFEIVTALPSGSWPSRLRRAVQPLLLDAAFWAVGVALALVAAAVSPIIALALFAAVAVLAAEAARHVRRHGLSQRRADELQRLARASERIETGGRPMATVAEQIREECHTILPFQWFQFELPGTGGEAISWTAGPDGRLHEGAPNPDLVPPALPGFHKRGAWDVLERELRAEGQLMARLRLWCDPRVVEPRARLLLDELLPQMGASVHRALLDREAKEDPLTRVPLRRVLEGRLQAAFRRACDEGVPIAVVMCDIDFFKRINDSFGHGVGDRALIEVAQALDRSRREGDLLCRYGGEEFTLLLVDTDGKTGLKLAERLRYAVESIRLQEDGKPVPLSLSAGVASFPELHIKTAGELLLLADAALYQAKRQGRNRCLLDLGGGRLRDVRGAVLESTAEARPPAEAPQIFV